MTINTAFILFAACAALVSGCSSTSSGQADKANKLEQDSACILQDDFESDPSPFLQHAGKGLKLTIVSGNEALSGRKSLCLDSMASSQEWICSAELSNGLKLIPGKGYVVEFKYLLADTANQSAENFFSAAGDKGRFYARYAFAAAPGQKGAAKFTFVLPDDAADAVLRYSSHGACRTLIDDIKVRQLKADIQPWLFKPDAFAGMRKTPTNPNMLDLSNPSLTLPKDKYFPMVDEFGQFKYAEWTGKVHSPEDLKASVEEERKYDGSRPDIPGRDRFGGLAGSACGAPGTDGFTTAKVDGKWFLRDPEGNLFWSVGITCVGNFPATTVTDREHYFERIDPNYLEYAKGYKPGTFYYGRQVKSYALGRKNIERKYGSGVVTNYWKIAAPRLKKWGMNTCGAWSSSDVTSSGTVPFTDILQSSGSEPLKTNRKLYVLWGGIPDYFTAAFETRTIQAARSHAMQLNSKYCIGAFVDNEISWQRVPGNTALAVLSCPPSQPAKIEMLNMLRNKYSDIAALNKAWRSGYSSWDDFLERTDFEPELKDAEPDLFAFEKAFCERYFTVCRQAVKLAAPRALYLGCRFASRNEIVERAAFEICDVVSYNIYKTSADNFAPPAGCTDKPVMIGEFHIGRIDKGSPYGGLLEVPDAARAAEAYKTYMTSAIENPHIVGAHWFQWFDCFVTGRGDGANATCGFVSTLDTPDYALTDACRDISSNLYEIRARKEIGGKRDH